MARQFQWLAFSVIFLTAALLGTQNAGAAAKRPAGKVRTYYVAADEVEWNYTPSGRDEAMGMPFDAIAKGFTQSGSSPDRQLNKKAIYREYTDAHV